MATDYTKLVLDQIGERVSSLDPKYINLIIWTASIAIALLVCYTTFTVLRSKNEIKAKRYFLKVTFSSKTMEKSDLVLEFVTLLSKLHSLAKGGIVTFEVHQNKTKDIGCFVITATRSDTLQSITQELEQIKGVSIVQDVVDPLLLIQSQSIETKFKPYVLKLSSSSTFGNFKSDTSVFIKSLIQNMRQLEDQDFGSMMIVFRPSFAQSKLRGQISKLNFRAMKNGKDYGIDHNLVKEVKELETKNISSIYSVKISVIGSRSFVVDNLTSCFNLLSKENYFVSKTNKFNIPSLRYTKAEDLYMPLNRGSYGSYLNCNELASLVQLVDFGSDNISKNTLTNTNQTVERSMTSFKDI